MCGAECATSAFQACVASDAGDFDLCAAAVANPEGNALAMASCAAGCSYVLLLFFDIKAYWWCLWLHLLRRYCETA